MKKKPLTELAESKRFVLNDLDRIMKKIQKENELIDDHGQAIIGKRDRLPLKADSEEDPVFE